MPATLKGMFSVLKTVSQLFWNILFMIFFYNALCAAFETSVLMLPKLHTVRCRIKSWIIILLYSGFTACQDYFTHFQPSQDQDQDSLLVKRRNDNHSPEPVIRELVPSSHQRSETTFINICINNGSLKCHSVLISTTPSFGDKAICWYTGFNFKIFI